MTSNTRPWGVLALLTLLMGLAFRNVDARAAMAAVVFGVTLYGGFTFPWTPIPDIHLMLVTLIACLAPGLAVNHWLFGRHASRALGLQAKPAQAA
ncbi:MAG: hypothetical protein V4759_05335 [Pseudomonadota bacterium]